MAKSDEATAKSDDDEELKRTSRQKLKRYRIIDGDRRPFYTKRVEAIYPLLKDVALRYARRKQRDETYVHNTYRKLTKPQMLLVGRELSESRMSPVEGRVHHTVDPCADPVPGSVEPNKKNKRLIMNPNLKKTKICLITMFDPVHVDTE
ncbi:hypothetical protein YC2023_011438 [Brassica napus]